MYDARTHSGMRYRCWNATHPKNDTVTGTTASVLKSHGNNHCQRSSMILAVVLLSVPQNRMTCAIARRKTRRHDMFRPSRGRIAQPRCDDGPVVRALLPSLPSLLLLSLDDDDPASVLSSPLQSPSPPPAAAPKSRRRRAHRPQPQRQVDGPRGRARPPSPPMLSSSNDNLPPPCRIRQRRTPLTPQ